MSPIQKLSSVEQLNFLLTNRIPRRQLTILMGRLSKIESPVFTEAAIQVWKAFASDLDFSESKEQRFNSLHECFIRQLKDGARKIEPGADIVTSPCDAIVGEFGAVRDREVIQAKGYPYQIDDLLQDPGLVSKYRNGKFLTLRIKSSMYHRFHAPMDCSVEKVSYISGDTWNVNPIALKRIENLFCKNERATLDLKLENDSDGILLVPVAAILVASINLNCLPGPLNLQYRGPNEITCQKSYRKGEEMGHFEHGSTIILFSTDNFRFAQGLKTGQRINMGEPVLEKESLKTESGSNK